MREYEIFEREIQSNESRRFRPEPWDIVLHAAWSSAVETRKWEEIIAELACDRSQTLRYSYKQVIAMSMIIWSIGHLHKVLSSCRTSQETQLFDHIIIW